jgi:mannose-6-phosphate isomerase-like protein (cupin superfamily)
MSTQPRTYSVAGDRYTFLATGAETGGAYAVFEGFVPPGHGSPPHVHHREDEAFYVIRGEFEFTVDGEKVIVREGGSIFGRRDVPHCFRNVGAGPGLLLITVTPAGFEHYFYEVGTPLSGPHEPPVPPTPEAIAHLVSAAPKYGLEIFGGPA